MFSKKKEFVRNSPIELNVLLSTEMYQLNGEFSEHFSVRLEPKYGETMLNGFNVLNSTTIGDKVLDIVVIIVFVVVVVVRPLGFVEFE